MVDQCLDRRIPGKATLIWQITAWERRRNAEKASIDWVFMVDRAGSSWGVLIQTPLPSR
jgi:hypothetical protein